MPTQIGFAPGKTILSGEYAVVFGYPGLAVPSSKGITVTFTPAEDKQEDISLPSFGNHPEWQKYLTSIVEHCRTKLAELSGTVQIECDLPLGKGMGSSTALVCAMVRALLGNDEQTALEIEDTLNPGHSGLDFAVIWSNEPTVFRKGHAPEKAKTHIDLSSYSLIDTGTPDQTTPQLVAWVKEREAECKPHLETIGRCTERLLQGEDLVAVMRDHHRAQLALGVVPPEVAKLIEKIEAEGGAAKVIGAGGRTGGAGMVLAKNSHPQLDEE